MIALFDNIWLLFIERKELYISLLNDSLSFHYFSNESIDRTQALVVTSLPFG